MRVQTLRPPRGYEIDRRPLMPLLGTAAAFLMLDPDALAQEPALSQHATERVRNVY